MTVVPYTLLVIKPMSIGRGHGPVILENILENCPVSLRSFRSWPICDSTLYAMTRDTGPHSSILEYELERIHPPRQIHSWCCIFTHLDRSKDPTDTLNNYCGPFDRTEWLNDHLRYKFAITKNPTDTVVHIPQPTRTKFESNLLFLNFDEEAL